eukprot:9026943-Lingulodinium_polyedra.AAC.1
MPQRGDPRFSATCADESFNGVLKGVAQSTHPRHFNRRFLAKYQVMCVCAGRNACPALMKSAATQPADPGK